MPITTPTELIEAIQRRITEGALKADDTLLVTTWGGDWLKGLSPSQHERLTRAQGDLLQEWEPEEEQVEEGTAEPATVKTFLVLYGVEGWGRALVEATSEEEAKKLFEEGEWRSLKEDLSYHFTEVEGEEPAA